jgi:hypothetical protein
VGHFWTEAYLVVQEPLLHAVVGANLLEDVPGKLAVELVGTVRNGNRDHTNDHWGGDEERPCRVPDCAVGCIRPKGAAIYQFFDGVVDLVDLEERVHKQNEVRDAEADDLNRVLPPQGIPRQGQDVDEAEDEEGQESGDRAVSRFHICCQRVAGAELLKVGLEDGKYVSASPASVTSSIDTCGPFFDLRLQGYADDSLQRDGGEEEHRPCCRQKLKGAGSPAGTGTRGRHGS